VNPLTVSIQSNGKKRLILDLREVNVHLWKQSVKYDDLRLALLYLEKGFWMIKFDIHSAYHFIDIFMPHTEYLGFLCLSLHNDARISQVLGLDSLSNVLSSRSIHIL
jgi:hypothetical protein